MEKKRVNIKKLKREAIIPTYGSEFSAGADLYACVEEDMILKPGDTRLIPTGIALEIPAGYAGLIYARSGIATKRGLAPANKVGVVDSDYRGEVLVSLHNHSQEAQMVAPGERIAQLVVTPVLAVDFCEVEELEETRRAGGGFGSTGK
ncbi:dUTP diphosphatase [Christensenella timonensis]|uniref:dUTP diphosphatase n=1 Tax=Christensenella timonensis TaxID=1816678 RepID=UPI00082DD690|nr:dUTP diphosphatase [Christensenella timonensis]